MGSRNSILPSTDNRQNLVAGFAGGTVVDKITAMRRLFCVNPNGPGFAEIP
jgi:hypothetical protein